MKLLELTPLLFCLVGCVASTGFDPEQTKGDGGGKDGAAADDGGATSGDDAAIAVDDAGSFGVDANYNTATVCTSGQYWTLGDTKSANMHPGVACRSCHVLLGKASSKDFDISGTVYPTAHEPDDCNGVSGVTVVITDANNADHTLTVNSAGNFYNDDLFGLAKIPTPYHAKIVKGTQVRAMLAAQTIGDCNSCHTETGAQNAPGRIMAP